MANQDKKEFLEQIIANIEATEFFTKRGKNAKIYQGKSGRVLNRNDVYKELNTLFPRLKDPNGDQQKFFEEFSKQKENNAVVKQYYKEYQEIHDKEQSDHPEEKKEEKEKKEEEKNSQIFKETPKPKEEEKEKQEETKNSDNNAEQQPLQEQPIPGQPALQPEVTTPVINENQQTPKIDFIKPLPYTPTPQYNKKPGEVDNKPVLIVDNNQKQSNQQPKIENTKPLNPTLPPVVKTQGDIKPEIKPQPNISPQTANIKPQAQSNSTRVFTPIPTKLGIMQTVKKIATSEPVKKVVKEVSFQAQMGIKKLVDKGIQITGSFLKGGLETAREFFQGNSGTSAESFGYPDQSFEEYNYLGEDDYTPVNQTPAQSYEQAARQRSQLGRIPNRNSRFLKPRPSIPGKNKISFFRTFAGRAVIASGISFLIYFVFFSGILESTAPLMNFGQTTTGEASPFDSGLSGLSGFCPTPEVIDLNRDPLTCRYLNPPVGLFDTNLSQEGINNYIEKYSPVFVKAGKGDKTEFIRRVNYIVAQSKQAGLNPALFLGYWKSESAFSTYPGASDMGCAPRQESMRGFERQVQCALGLISGGSQSAMCAISKEESSKACLGEQGRITSYPDVYNPAPKIPISTFDDFMEMYGPRSQNLVKYESTPDGLNRNCSSTYNTLLEVVATLNACQASAQTVAGPIIPFGENGAKIANVGIQIASQLLHSIKDRTQIQSLGMNCALGSPNGDANSHFTGYHCWSEMTNPKYDIVPDPNYLQCTEFIIAVFDKAGFYNQIRLISYPGDARDWANNARKYSDKFEVFTDARQLQPGDIISLGAVGNAGHVALVVKKEENRITVAQAATSERMEDWFIETKTGTLNPGYNYVSREMTGSGGFIRLLDFKERPQ